ncbi:DUF1350 family protein [Oculatella sp. LEGE 06141]|uniref:DUF1350 family protein n=1 Tax=Oculatella sp. LEGE 06141 TaxID=1828648 RepID=UPI0018807576|nr:DUF1350 family protein [Oculatella sp. LEGE 06141]MBE9177956.1 DUF1350 family protein [Oculatella sp. LEGE 06141]
MIWQEIYGNWVLVPPRPVAVIHFLGGAFVATAPHVTYRWLLENLANQGYAVVATPFVNTLDHAAIAKQTLRIFNLGLEHLLTEVIQKRYLPVYGIGHSMGCKLHLLIGSLFPQERAGNILISFNNYPARRAIPLVEQFVQFSPNFAIEFTPSPEETNLLIEKQYQVRRNLLVKFRNDDIDQTRPLSEAMLTRFPEMTTIQILNGNHLTPLGQDVSWTAGASFTPLDAIAQFVRQEVYRDLNQLKRTVLLWLDPMTSLP